MGLRYEIENKKVFMFFVYLSSWAWRGLGLAGRGLVRSHRHAAMFGNSITKYSLASPLIDRFLRPC